MAAIPLVIKPSSRNATAQPESVHTDHPVITPPPTVGVQERDDAEIVAPDLMATTDGNAYHYEAIAEAAYFLAQARGFEPGHELDDWLLAERQLGSS